MQESISISEHGKNDYDQPQTIRAPQVCIHQMLLGSSTYLISSCLGVDQHDENKPLERCENLLSPPELCMPQMHLGFSPIMARWKSPISLPKASIKQNTVLRKLWIKYGNYQSFNFSISVMVKNTCKDPPAAYLWKMVMMYTNMIRASTAKKVTTWGRRKLLQLCSHWKLRIVKVMIEFPR